MEMKTIEKNEKTTVKAVYFSGKFFCTVIYFKGEDGFVEKIIRVYADGAIEIQQDGKARIIEQDNERITHEKSYSKQSI